MPAIPAPMPRDEAARLAALRALRILDTLAEPLYDDLVRLAAQVCGTPIGLVSLVDAERQWFKARLGLAAQETPRELAFCAHAIAAPEAALVVEDARRDARFRDNPLVTGAPHIRFYAGVPIVLGAGQAMGTVCVIDTEPRTLTPAQLQALQALARQAAALLELRRNMLAAEHLAQQAARERERSAELLELVLRGGDLGLWDLRLPDGAYTINAREREMLGYAADEARPERLDWQSLVHPDDWPTLKATMAPHLRGEVPYYESEHRLRHRDGHWVWVLDHAVVVERAAGGAPTRIVGTHMDITERKRTEAALRLSEQRLSLALASSRAALFDWDIAADRIHRGANLAAMRGGPAADVVCTLAEVRELIHPDDVDSVWSAVRATLRGETGHYDFEHRIRRLDGGWIWLHAVGRVTERGGDGRALRVSGTDEDVTERKAAELALRDSQRRLRLITDNLPALIAYIDREQRYGFLSGQIQRVFGIDTDASLGRTMREIRSEAAYAVLAPHVEQALRGESVSFTYAERVQGRPLRFQSTYVPDVDSDGTVRGFYSMTVDVTELHETQRQLEELARVDPLTGLPNRRQFDERLHEAMLRSRRTLRSMALIFLDIDHFKAINDSLGHAAGDAVLREFGRRLRTGVRGTDVVARYAGDEFVIVLEGIDGVLDLKRVADKIVAAIRPRFQIDGRTLAVTTSAGLAIYRGTDHTTAELVALADGALYQAKRQGRDRYTLA